MKIKCSECGKRIRTGQKFYNIQGQDMHDSCYQKLGGYDFYTELKQLDSGDNKPVPPPLYYILG